MVSLLILYLWVSLLFVFVGSYLFYFGYLRRRAKCSWGFEIDSKFTPSVSILVPAFNEEKLIKRKIENLKAISYPREKMEVLLVDDASTDNTLAIAGDFIAENADFPVQIVPQGVRRGKANALNSALKHCSAEIVIVTDADTLLPADILLKTLPYFSNPAIGALSAVAEPENSAQSWVANAEKNYLDMMSVWRLGESKIHSTFRFEGCFCAYRRSAFQEFDNESGSDDSGTALRIIQSGFRTIVVPEARVPAEVSSKSNDYVKAKTRRAVQLAGLWAQCSKFLVRGCLKLPKKIVAPEIFLSLFTPVIFVAIVGLTFLLLFFYLVPIGILFIVIGLACLVPRARSFLFRSMLDQLILFYALLLSLQKKKYVVWDHSR